MGAAAPPQPMRKTCGDFAVLFQVDVFSQRLLVTDYQFLTRQREGFFAYLQQLAAQVALTKIIVQTREKDQKLFLRHGFVPEAANPYFFQGQPMLYCSKFLSASRSLITDAPQKDRLVEMAQQKTPAAQQGGGCPEAAAGITLRRADERDVPPLIELYRRAFSSYPTPIDNAAYLTRIIREEQAYFVVAAAPDGAVVSAASADLDRAHLCAEVTDCATHPDYQGQQIMYHLVQKLERAARHMGLCSLYTLARAQSAGMNIVFGRCGYHFGGRLIRNCHICGGYEDMHLWFKKL